MKNMHLLLLSAAIIPALMLGACDDKKKSDTADTETSGISDATTGPSDADMGITMPQPTPNQNTEMAPTLNEHKTGQGYVPPQHDTSANETTGETMESDVDVETMPNTDDSGEVVTPEASEEPSAETAEDMPAEQPADAAQ